MDNKAHRGQIVFELLICIIFLATSSLMALKMVPKIKKYQKQQQFKQMRSTNENHK